MDNGESRQVFGESMRRNRAMLGLSVRDAAERAGISKNTILRIESGLPVQKASVVRLSRAYGMVPIDPAHRKKTSVEGEHYCYQPLEAAVWYANRVNTEGLVDAYSEPGFSDPTERNRLGWNGLVTHFGSPLRVRREGSRFIPYLVDVYRATDVSNVPSGERFMLVLRGEVRVHVGDESFELKEGEAGAFDAVLPHWVEPVKPVERGEAPPRILQVVLP